MARPRQAPDDDVRDDADVRGEHVYGIDRSGRKIPAESEKLVRQPGHYVAGADGTQDVAGADKTQDVPDPQREQPPSHPSPRKRDRDEADSAR
jgi:hypothetical protein